MYLGIDPERNIKPFISIKPRDSYPEDVINEIKLLSFSKDKDATPFGSFIYRIQKYPGDVDLVEEFTDCCTIKEVTKKFAKKLKEMVRKISAKRTHYFTEFKAGVDKRFNVDIGTLQNGIYTPGSQLEEQIKRLIRHKLLPNDEIKAINQTLSKLIMNGNDYDIIYNIFREHMILRWNVDEILVGVKKLPDRASKKLEQALGEHGHIKIDMVTSINGKFVEVTNFLQLSFIKDGEPVHINIDIEENHDIPKMLPIDINRLYYSNFHYNPFKMVKRIYSLTRHNQDIAILQKILPVISSNISLMYQIKSELDAIMLVLKLYRSPSPKAIFENLDNIKLRLATVLEIGDEELESISTLINKANKTKENHKKIEILKQIKQKLVDIINYETIIYLDKVGLNPPPSNLLPPKVTYDRSLVRTAFETVENPVKKILGGSIATWAFKNAANLYRRNFCDGRARPLLDGEFHLGCHNFTGPGTRIDLPEVANYTPYNSIDACSRAHDIAYGEYKNNPEKIREADEEAIRCYNKYPNESGYTASTLGINGKMALENVFPLILKSIAAPYSGKGWGDFNNADFQYGHFMRGSGCEQCRATGCLRCQDRGCSNCKIGGCAYC